MRRAVKYLGFMMMLLLNVATAFSQKQLAYGEAVRLAINNRQNLAASQLAVRQQRELTGTARFRNSPSLNFEISPYEGPLIGIQQQFNLPAVTRSRRIVQNERLQLANLQLQLTEQELKRTISLNYLQLQYLEKYVTQLKYQDSVYQAISVASDRFFKAGQINKLEQLTASTQAAKVRNDLLRSQSDYHAEKQMFYYLTAYNDSFVVEPLIILTETFQDSLNSLQVKLLEQQVAIGRAEAALQRSSLLPSITGGVMFPLTSDYKRAVGIQAGVALPIWRYQNRAALNAARTGIEITEAERHLAVQRLNASYRQLITRIQRDARSIDYFHTVALPQSREIIQTSQRLFQGGQLNYIESLRNLINAFEIQNTYLETIRSHNEMIVETKYLNSSL
jgi:outer membrane protein, heavy metal efflux system